MVDELFVFAFLLFPFVVVRLLSVVGVKMLRLSIPSFVILFMFINSYVGILPLYFGWDSYRYYGNAIQDQTVILKMFFFSAWTILMMAIGMASAKMISRDRGLINVSGPKRGLHRRELWWFMGFVVLSSIVFIVYLIKVPSIALFVAITSGPGEAALARSQMGNDFSGGYHWYKLFMRDGLFLSTFVLFANWLANTTRSRMPFLLFAVTFMIASFSSVAATEKAPMAHLLLGLFLVYVIVRRRGAYPVGGVAVTALAATSVLAVFYVNFMGSSSIGAAIQSIASRLFTGGIAPAYWYLQMFPRVRDFLWGTSFPNPGGLLPFEPYRLTVEVMNFFNPGLRERGIVGSAPTVFWAELYANFGVPGVILVPFFVGVGIYLFSMLVGRLENTPLRVGFIVWAAQHYANLSVTSLSGFIVDFYMLALVAMLLLVIAGANRGVLKYEVARGAG